MCIYGAIVSDVYEKIANASTAKEVWDCLINCYVGARQGKKGSVANFTATI
jgi:hypothetical protein